MFKKNRLSNDQITVSTLNRTISRSFLAKYKIKTTMLAGRVKRFFREYRLPSIATSVFLILLLGLVIVRQLEQTSLISLRNEVTSGENGYSVLLSSDEADQFTRGDTAEDPGQTAGADASNSNSTQNTPSSFNLVVDGSAPTGNGTGTVGSGGGSGGNGGGSTPVSQPFSAIIESFAQSNVTLVCSNPSKPNKGSCSKTYSFGAGVRTQHGPGNVSYSWQSSIDSGNGTGSFNTDQSGSVLTTASKDINITCTKDSSFTVRFSIVLPSSSNSSVLTTNHNCNEL